MLPEIQKHSLQEGYVTKVWGIANLLPTTAFLLLQLARGNGDLFLIIFIFVPLVGALLSLPALLANMLLCRWLAESSLSTPTAKGFIVAAGFGFVGITFGIGAALTNVDDLKMVGVAIVAYGISAGIGAIHFPLRSK